MKWRCGKLKEGASEVKGSCLVQFGWFLNSQSWWCYYFASKGDKLLCQFAQKQIITNFNPVRRIIGHQSIPMLVFMSIEQAQRWNRQVVLSNENTAVAVHLPEGWGIGKPFHPGRSQQFPEKNIKCEELPKKKYLTCTFAVNRAPCSVQTRYKYQNRHRASSSCSLTEFWISWGYLEEKFTVFHFRGARWKFPQKSKTGSFATKYLKLAK